VKKASAPAAATQIYYYSGTGNSLHVARELQKRLAGSELVPILALADEDPVVASGEAVGFVFPHYASSLPKVVSDFIERLDVAAARYLFAIATRGGTRTMAFVEIDKILKHKGRRLDSFFALTMPASTEPLLERYPSRINSERIQRLETGMLARLDEIQPIIAARAVDRDEDTGAANVPAPWLAPFMPLLEAITPLLLPLGKLAESSFRFYVDERCAGCGVCEQICLSGKLRLVQGRPVWAEDVQCHGCFACLNYCPEQAVQVASRWYLKSHTETTGRYHHPRVTAADIAAQKPALSWQKKAT
jgi:ferredoxin/flavodoxin